MSKFAFSATENIHAQRFFRGEKVLQNEETCGRLETLGEAAAGFAFYDVVHGATDVAFNDL